MYIARGEKLETRSHLAVAFGRKYIIEEEFKSLNESYRKLTKNTNLYINGLKDKSKQQNNQ